MISRGVLAPDVDLEEVITICPKYSSCRKVCPGSWNEMKNITSLIANWDGIVALIHGYFPYVFLVYRNNTLGSWLPDRINVAAS
jgi:hypothetical protein